MENIANNYKKVYAINKIYRPVGFDEFGYRNYGLAAYIAMEGYLTKEVKTYNRDGSHTISYEIVFVLDNNLNKQVPNYNFNNKITNVSTVYKIYDNYETAKEDEKQLNEELITNSWILEKPDKAYKIKRKFINDLDKLQREYSLAKD